MAKRRLSIALAGVAFFALSAAPVSPSIFVYIKQTWTRLTRSNQDLASAAADPKFKPSVNGRWPVYIAKNDFSRAAQQLRSDMPSGDFEKIELRQLPDDPLNIREQGLLYLPRPYVVPGGRFNEMYGWDSFFIQMGLLRDDDVALAQDMADNFLYEIREYGKILNANRTYYLTRSQPPLLTGMILAVYNHTHDRRWLEDAVPAIETYYRYWTREPHLIPETGLSRYFDLGEGPAPEVVASEHDAHGRTDYDLVRQYFRSHKIADYDVTQYYNAATDQLTPLFYKGDRSMRESGFDPSSRFGPFSVDIIHYNPVCLNSLLYLMEMQTAEILSVLHRDTDAGAWRERAARRAQQVNRLMWDAPDGLYYDYDFVHRRVRHYPFLTTFYPLWAGIASPEQAASVVANLAKFERPGGLETSQFKSGDQWDAPFGWAPLEWIAVQGLRRYGYSREADRVSEKFLSLVLRNFAKYGTLEEKYNVVKGTAAVGSSLRYGYRSNEAGFGWTNAVFTSLFDELPRAAQRNLQESRR
ncbi:MAG TPA: trehalase family glycosidase [Bryobacteraceae bacterium]|nr:trehalase family glycosidase [Bryobacteraceae bacterium]